MNYNTLITDLKKEAGYLINLVKENYNLKAAS
jgi:hypothetical protein